jgi:glutamine amidotransferase
MCRLLGYLGPSVPLNSLLFQPDHSLVVQSYQPWEMNNGLVNADGFGVGWYHPQREGNPFVYKNTLPIWSDTNLPSLSRYVESGCILASIRNSTSSQGLDISNCQPFIFQNFLGVHNGQIENFQHLRRPLSDRLSDIAYQSIQGNSDSEHVFALLLHEWQANPSAGLVQALDSALFTLDELAKSQQVAITANMLVTDGHCLIAARFASGTTAPSLYWLPNVAFPEAVIVASEPLFAGSWHRVPEQTLLSVTEDLQVRLHPLPWTQNHNSSGENINSLTCKQGQEAGMESGFSTTPLVKRI